MKDQDKSKQQLISELGELRQRVASEDRETEAALVLQVAPVGIHECDTEGRTTFVNPFQEKITGYTAEELVGTYIWDWIEPGPQKDSLPVYLKHLVSEQPPPTPFVTRNTKKNGEVCDIRVDWNCKRNPQGQVTGFVSIISDITEQRQTEQQLRHSERTLRTLMDASPESILLLDSKGTILFANTTAARRLGRTFDEMVGRTPYDVFPSEVAAVRTRYFAEVVRTGEPIRFADERFDRYIETALHPVLDEKGKVAAVAVLGIDQTERKHAEEALKKAHDELERRVEERTAELARANQQLKNEVEVRRHAEEALRQSHDQLRAIYDGIIEGLIITDIETTRFVRVNSSACRMLGYSEQELLAASIYNIHPPEEVPNDLQRFQAIAEGRAAIQRDGRLLRKDGSILHVDITGHKIVYEGRPCTLAFWRDVTERKQAESEMAYLASFPERDPQPVMEVGLDGDIRYMNPAVCRLFPELREQGAAHPWLAELGTVNHLVCKGQTDITIQDVSVANRTYQQSFFYSAPDQTICIYGLDTTERNRTEQALRQSHDELRAIYDGMVEGLVILDSETKRLVRVNSSLCRMLGYTGEELLLMSIMDVHPADDRGGNLQRIQARAEGRVEEDTDVPMLRKDGSVFYADILGNRLAYGGRPCVLGLFRDITERKQTQAALEREHHTLKHLLESSDHERQLIAYEIHDGLAQQLAGAIMQFQTFGHLKDKKPRLAAKAYDAGMTMLQQGHFEARRLISGVRPPILDEEGIAAAIAHLVQEQSRLKGPKIDYHSSVDFDRLVPILENAIYRIAQEGLANACQHSKSEKVRVSLVQREDRVRIEIRDWGIGFKPREARQGCYGLVGMRQRARLLGGRCSIRSTPGKGTRIAVELPVVLRESEG